MKYSVKNLSLISTSLLVLISCDTVNSTYMAGKEATSSLFGMKSINAPGENKIIDNGDYKFIVANKGDSLAALAAKVNITPQALADTNGLPIGYIAKQNEKIALPFGANISALGAPISQEQWDAQSGGINPIGTTNLGSTGSTSVHSVGNGETIYDVARLYNVPVTSLTSANNLNANLDIYPGQLLTIPQNTSATTTPVNNNTATTSPTNSNGFTQPVSGSIKTPFSQSPESKSDGIVYSVASGTNVKATSGGTVALVSNSTGSQGTVVMIKHDNNLISVYTNLKNVNVTKNQSVTKGQHIAQVEGSEMMFQIRNGSTPVNPSNYF